MVLGRREKSSQASIRGSRIVAAIGIGVTLGCVFAFFFPLGFFSPNQPTQIRPLLNSNFQVVRAKKKDTRAKKKDTGNVYAMRIMYKK